MTDKELFPNFKHIHTVKNDVMFLLTKKNSSAVFTYTFIQNDSKMFLMRFYNFNNLGEAPTYLDGEFYENRTDYSLERMRVFYKGLRVQGFERKTFGEVYAEIAQHPSLIDLSVAS